VLDCCYWHFHRLHSNSVFSSLIKLKKNIQGSAAEAAAPADDGEMKSGKCENAKYAAM